MVKNNGLQTAGFADVFVVYAKIDGEHFQHLSLKETMLEFLLGLKKRKWELKVLLLVH